MATVNATTLKNLTDILNGEVAKLGKDTLASVDPEIFRNGIAKLLAMSTSSPSDSTAKSIPGIVSETILTPLYEGEKITLDETPIYLAPRAEIEEWLRQRWDAKTVKIVSGLESDKPMISSPKELDLTLVNIHKEGDPASIPIEEKRCRALEDAHTHLGLRTAILCYLEHQDIHKEWHPYWAYFSNAIVELDGRLYVVCLDPSAEGCVLACRWLGSKSDDDIRFARLGGS